MEPITTMIAGALAAGAAAGATAVATEAVKDAYAAFKSLVIRKLGGQTSIESSLTTLEKMPDSEDVKSIVEGELQAGGAASDDEIVAQAKALLDLLKESGQLDETNYNVIVSGGGAAAVGPGAVAAGKGGIAVGGDVQGGIRLGGASDDDEEN
jgi:hypothetical protein